MTFRSLILGLSLALLIAAFTYFNDFVIKQTMFIGNFLPISLFGLLLLAALVGNPLVSAIGLRPLRPTEFAVIAALGLAACGFPGSNFWRYAGAFVTTPGRVYSLNPAWRAKEMMSYLPDGSPRLAPGQVYDGATLAAAIVEHGRARADQADPPDAAAALAARLWLHAGDAGRDTLAQTPTRPPLLPQATERVAQAINTALAEPELVAGLWPGLPPPDRLSAEGRALIDAAQHRTLSEHETIALHRALLDALFAEQITARPRGGPVIVGHGRADDPDVEDMLLGSQAQRLLADPRDVPWAALWGPLRFWAGAALLLGLASLLLAVVFHPQWASRELLAYPIPRFFAEATQRHDNHLLPTITRVPSFWIAFGLVLLIHGINGLHVWYPVMPDIPLRFNFTPLSQLFPNASQVALNQAVFHPQLFFTVVGFAYFLPRSVSLSLGVSMLLWVMAGSVFVSLGVPIAYDKFTPNNTNALRLGSYLGMLAMILYTGRRYYGLTLRGALGLGTSAEVPAASVWAMRLLPVTLILLVWLLVASGLDWPLAIGVVAVCLLVLIVTSRVICETGCFLISGPFMPAAILLGLMGYEAVGPTGFAMAAFAGFLLLGDPREAVMPYIATGLKMIENISPKNLMSGKTSPTPRLGWAVVLLAGVLVLSMVVAGFATLSLQRQHGIMNLADGYTTHHGPNSMFRNGLNPLADAEAVGTLGQIVRIEGWSRLLVVNPTPGTISWTMVGLLLVVGCAAARFRLPWWPLHPVIFIVWGTWALQHMSFSFFVGWLIKTAVLYAGGVAAFARFKPIMVGLIAGELLGGLLWVGVGTTNYFITGTPAMPVRVLP